MNKQLSFLTGQNNRYFYPEWKTGRREKKAVIFSDISDFVSPGASEEHLKCAENKTKRSLSLSLLWKYTHNTPDKRHGTVASVYFLRLCGCKQSERTSTRSPRTWNYPEAPPKHTSEFLSAFQTHYFSRANQTGRIKRNSNVKRVECMGKESVCVCVCVCVCQRQCACVLIRRILL